MDEPDDDLLGTCDWGYCDGFAVGYRASSEHGWLPVCPAHVDLGLMRGVRVSDNILPSDYDPGNYGLRGDVWWICAPHWRCWPP